MKLLERRKEKWAAFSLQTHPRGKELLYQDFSIVPKVCYKGVQIINCTLKLLDSKFEGLVIKDLKIKDIENEDTEIEDSEITVRPKRVFSASAEAPKLR